VPVILNAQQRHRASAAQPGGTAALRTARIRSRISSAQPSELRKKFALSRRLSDLQLHELQSLVKGLDVEEDGKLTLSRVHDLFTTSLDPPLDSEDVDKILEPLSQGKPFSEVSVAVEEILDTLRSGPGPALLKQRTQDLSSHVSRDDLAKSIANLVDKNDALMTLPLTLAYIIIFVFLVAGHLQINERRHMEQALESWVDGRDPRTSCSENVDNMEAFWEWMLGPSDGLAGVFGVGQTSDDGRFEQYRLANRNILLGDVQLVRQKEDGEEKLVWLIHSPVGQKYLENSTQRGGTIDYLGASKAAAHHLMANDDWSNPSIMRIQMSFITYNQMAEMFALTHVQVYFGHYGQVKSVINAEAVSINPYPPSAPLNYVFDTLYTLMVLYIAWNETKDLCAALRLGCGEFLDYWAFWNIIDWICIILGVTNIVIWIVCCIEMADDAMHSLLQDGALNMDVMALGATRLAAIMDRLSRLRDMYLVLHIAMALNTISIVMKFFKAFTSNPRLRVVTDTFKKASVDFAHYGIIFVTIFLPFSIIGHVLFGNDIEQFSSIFSSVNTALLVVFGDFGWYTDVTSTLKLSGSLPSGLPILILFMWYILYVFLVVLVLLNMLLAIIIEHYTNVYARMIQGDSPTIWSSVLRWLRYRSETRQFITLQELRLGLENDSDPVHPEEDVSLDSLIGAWPTMEKKQALWILRLVKQDLPQEEPEGATLEDLKELLESQQEELRNLPGSVGEAATSKSEVSPHMREALARISRRLDDLVESVSKLRRDQTGLTRRIEQLGASVGGAAATPRRPPPLEKGKDLETMSELSSHTLMQGGSTNADGSRGREAERRKPMQKDRERRRHSAVGTKLRDRDKLRVPEKPSDKDRPKEKERGREKDGAGTRVEKE